jgi:hypothetical protein
MLKLKLASGFFATIVILFNTGCATPAPLAPHRSMNYQDLSWFAIDCRKKTEQIAMLQAMRPTKDEKLFAYFTNQIFFWEMVTDSDSYKQRQQLSANRIDWLISQHLMRLRDC